MPKPVIEVRHVTELMVWKARLKDQPTVEAVGGTEGGAVQEVVNVASVRFGMSGQKDDYEVKPLISLG